MPTKFARDIRSAPNLITLSRIVLTMVAVPLYFAGALGIALVIAVIAGVTDYADGIVARRTGQVTRLGEILDQFSDLCYESLLLLIAVSQGFLPAGVLFIYLFREFWVSCIRRFMAGERLNIPSSLAGKLKSNFIMWGFLPTFLSICGYLPALEPYLGWLGKVAIGVGLVASYVSAISYTRAFVIGYSRDATADAQNARTG